MREEENSIPQGKNVTWQKEAEKRNRAGNKFHELVIDGLILSLGRLYEGFERVQSCTDEWRIFTAIWNQKNLDKWIAHVDWKSNPKNGTRFKTGVFGSGEFTKHLAGTCCKWNIHQVIYMEQQYDVVMSVDRYMGAWHSTNDIQAQAGPIPGKIISMIEFEIKKSSGDNCSTYKSRAWTGKSIKVNHDTIRYQSWIIAKLQGKLTTALILDTYVFTTAALKSSPDIVCENIRQYFANVSKVIVQLCFNRRYRRVQMPDILCL